MCETHADFLFAFGFGIPPCAQDGQMSRFARVVHWPLMPATVQQSHVIDCELHILVCFYSVFTSCAVELESQVCSHCHLQAPSGMDAIK